MNSDDRNSEGHDFPDGVRVLDSDILGTNRRTFLKAIGGSTTVGLAFSGTAAADDEEDDDEDDDEEDDDEDDDEEDDDEDDDEEDDDEDDDEEDENNVRQEIESKLTQLRDEYGYYEYEADSFSQTTEHGHFAFSDGTSIPVKTEFAEDDKYRYTIDGQEFQLGEGWE